MLQILQQPLDMTKLKTISGSGDTGIRKEDFPIFKFGTRVPNSYPDLTKKEDVILF